MNDQTTEPKEKTEEDAKTVNSGRTITYKEIPDAVTSELTHEVMQKVYKWAKFYAIIPLLVGSFIITFISNWYIKGDVTNHTTKTVTKSVDKANKEIDQFLSKADDDIYKMVNLTVDMANKRVDSEIDKLVQITDVRYEAIIDNKLGAVEQEINELKDSIFELGKFTNHQKEIISTMQSKGFKNFEESILLEEAIKDLKDYALEIVNNSKMDVNEKTKAIKGFNPLGTEDYFLKD